MDKQVADYLQIQPIDSAPYSDEREPVQSRIFRVLARSKFRSAPLAKDTADFVRQHIADKVSNNQPVILVYAMGGGRGIGTHNFPHADWGEYLHLKFLAENLYPIGEIYEPGLEIHWALDDYAARIFNNYQKDWQDQYEAGFDALLGHFTKKSIGIAHKRIPTSTWYKDFDTLERRIIDDAKAKQGTKEGDDIIKNWRKRAANNYHNAGSLSGDELQKAIDFSALQNMAWLDHDFEVRGDFFGSGIPIAHFTDFPDSLYIQTVSGSNTQFWKGNGYLELKDGRYKSRIATREVWEQIKPDLEMLTNPLAKDLPDLGKLPLLKL